MIEPLRFNPEYAPPLAITKPVFCSLCLSNRKKRDSPNVAIKYCMDCVDKSKMFYCLHCDEQFHRVGAPKNHRRRILVLGAGVRKAVNRRGDGVSYPLPLDYVTIRMRATIYHDNKIIYQEKKSSYLKFFAGLSGDCVHIQILGAKNIVAANAGGTTDAYVVGVYSGTKVGYTRVRWKTCNPRWINESFIVPMGTHLQDPRNTPKSQRGLFRLEAYNYQMVGSHSFLGHVEIDRAKLLRIALAAKQQPILMPLSTREFHGRFRPQLGVDSYNVTVKAVNAEALDMPNPLTGCYPYVKVYFGEGAGLGGGEYLGATPYCKNTVDPEWAQETNEFRLKINDVLRCERRLLLLRKQIEVSMAEELKTVIANRKSRKKEGGRGSVSVGSGSMSLGGSDELQHGVPVAAERSLEEIQKDNDPKKFVVFRFELWDYSMLMPHSPLGTVTVGIDDLRDLCPELPRALVKERDPPSRQDRLDATKRILLNPISGQNPCLAAFCGSRAEVQKELLAGEEDDDFWAKNIQDSSSQPLPVQMQLVTAFDDDSSVITSSTLHTKTTRASGNDEFELEETNKLSAKNLERHLSAPKLGQPSGGDGGSSQQLPEGAGNNSLSGASGSISKGKRGGSQRSRIDAAAPAVAGVDPSLLQQPGTVVDEAGLPFASGSYADGISELDGNEEQQQQQEEGGPLLGAPLKRRKQPSLCTRLVAWLTCRPLARDDDDEDLEDDPIRWGRLRDYDVEQESTKKMVETKSGGTDRGHLVLRLIPSSRGNVLTGLDEGVRHMTLGEQSDLKVRWDKAYSNYCQGDNIPARSNIVFRTELLTINGWGKIYMPFRVARRAFRFATWSCKQMHKYAMRLHREAQRQKRCLRCCKSVYALCCLRQEKKEQDDFCEDEELIEEEEESSDEEEEAPLRSTVKLSNRMKKLVTPSAVHGSAYLFGFNPRPAAVAKRGKKNKKGKGSSELDTIGEEGNSDDEGKEEEVSDDEGEGQGDGEGDGEGGEGEGGEGEGGEGEGGEGEQAEVASPSLAVGDARRLDLSNLSVAAAESGGEMHSQRSQRSQRSARPAPPAITKEEAALLPDPADAAATKGAAVAESSARSTGSSSGSEKGPAPLRPSAPPPSAP